MAVWSHLGGGQERRQTPIRWPWLLAVPLLLVASLVVLRWRPQPSFSVELGQEKLPSGVEAVGLYLPEGTADAQYRWVSDRAFLQRRHAFHLAPAFLANLTVKMERPDGFPALTFTSNEQPLMTVVPDKRLRVYTMLVPDRGDPEASLRFGTQTTAFHTPADPRYLAFITTNWRLVPLIDQPTVVDIKLGDWLVILLAALVTGLWCWWKGGLRLALLLGGVMLVLLPLFAGWNQGGPLSFWTLVMMGLVAVMVLPLAVRAWWNRAALAALALLTTFAGAIWPSWMTDDALISFRYAQNLARGAGLVYNVGERVEGYTNFLWTVLAALVIRLGGDPVALSYPAGVVLGVALVGATYWLARPWLGESWSVVAAALVATSHSVLIYTARNSALESGLFALLVVVASGLFLRERMGWAAAAFALALLTRPEGGLVWAIAVGVALLTWRRLDRRLGLLVGVFSLIVVPLFLWRWSYYGDLLPNTFYAKTGGGLAQLLRGLRYGVAFGLFAGGPVLPVLVMLACWRLIRQRRAFRGVRWLGYCVLVVAIFSAYIAAVGGDHFPGFRFFVPVVPFLAVVLAAGAQELTMLGLGSRPPLLALALVVVIGLCGFNLTRSRAFDEVIQGDDQSVWIWRELGWWLADHGKPAESMAALGAGAIPYYSDHPTADLLGLTDRYIAHLKVAGMGSGVAGHEKRDPAYILSVRQPTYIPDMWSDYFGGIDGLRATGLYDRTEIVTRTGRRLVVWKRR